MYHLCSDNDSLWEKFALSLSSHFEEGHHLAVSLPFRISHQCIWHQHCNRPSQTGQTEEGRHYAGAASSLKVPVSYAYA